MKQKECNKNRPLVFRRWNNKGYAVFNSLKKTIVIACLMVAYLLTASQKQASATTDTIEVTKNYDLEAIDVTAEQQPETYSGISRVIATITRSDIERAAVSSVTDLLEFASNIDVRQRGNNGIQADISIRGGTFDQVLILLNGVNITDPHTGHNNLNLPIDLSLVERIEILKGPGAWKFGMGAFSGAINIITRVPEKHALRIDLSAGQHAFIDGKLSADLHLKKGTHLLSFNRMSSDGYINNTDFQQHSLFYQGTRKIGKHEMRLQGGFKDKAFGANSFYTPLYPNQYEAMQSQLLSVSFKMNQKNLTVEPRVLYKRSNDNFVLFRDKPELYSNYHTTDVSGANILAEYQHGITGLTTLGIDFRSERIFSNNLGKPVDEGRYSPVNDTILLNRFHQRSNLSVFAGHKQYFRKMMINIGLNLSKNSDLQKWYFFPGLDLSYQINEEMAVFASANQTMRMPTFTDLYYKGPVNEGNSALKPEQSIGYEVGFQQQNSLFKTKVTGFYIQGTDLIDWVRFPDESVWKTTNHAQLNTLGLEVSGRLSLQETFPDQNIFKELKLAYTQLQQQKIETDLISNYSLNYLKHRFDLGLTHQLSRYISATWQLALQDRNGNYEKYEQSKSVGFVDYEPFVLVDLRVNWSKAGWTIYGAANNLFDASYIDIGNVVQPGRWLKMGISKKFEFR
ncbi:MAG: TonB-dependent receptor [Prolixibacteraceae bacterium]|nr:TonB-dependent receptor [Prolixibacteraceae bacterium]